MSSRTKTTSPATSVRKWDGPWVSLFFALLFFWGSADLTFATRLFGFNFRWGQALLLLAALPAAFRLWTDLKRNAPAGKAQLHIILPWLPFFAVYGTAAALSATPFLTGIKWGWGVFNIGLAALVCLSPLWGTSLEKGFRWALIAIVSFIWLQAIVLYGFEGYWEFYEQGPGMPGDLSFLSIPLGHAQASFKYMDFQSHRPCAFYYEPSYAGCAITFALFAFLYFDPRKKSSPPTWPLALALSAVILTSSRTGILSEAIFIPAVILIFALTRKAIPFLQSTLRSTLIAALLIGAFYVVPSGGKYLRFLAGPLGADSTNRIHTKGTSEGDRLSNAKESFRLWMQHPLLGNGITPQMEENNSQGLSQFSMVTWGELGLESGALGVLTFLFAILTGMWQAWKKSSDPGLRTVILTCWAIHFTVQFLLSQTFPRLDYWLIFFLSIRLLSALDPIPSKKTYKNA